MTDKTARCLALLLLLAGSPASAVPSVYHSPGDDGVDPGTPIELSGGPSASLFLYVDAGPAVSGSGTPCVDGDGDEVCAWKFCVETSDFVSVASFVQDPGRDLVWRATLGDFCATGGNALVGDLEPIRVGELVLGVAGAGTAEVVSGEILSADFIPDAVTPRLLALPEPGALTLLGAGLWTLFALARLRGARAVLFAMGLLGAVAIGLDAQAQDADADTVPDGDDNCPFVANPGQEDVGGLNGPPPDGVGDACQCGDLNGDGLVDLVDAALYERELAGMTPGAGDPETCSVIGGRLDCEPNDRLALREALVGLPPGLGQVCQAAVGAAPLPLQMSASGDSITQAFSADCTCNEGFGCLFQLLFCATERPQFSWFDGSSGSVTSLDDRYGELPGGTHNASLSGAELRGGSENFSAQVDAILAQPPLPELVTVELGGNDICNRGCVASESCGDPLYSDAEWVEALREGLDKLTGFSAGGLPVGATVYLLGVPRIQDLRAAGIAKQDADPDIDCEALWSSQDVCRIATADGIFNSEDLVTRTQGIAEQVTRYNEILRDEALAYTTDSNGRNPLGIEIVADYETEATSSIGTFLFGAPEINGGDCFHPSIPGQNELSETVWDDNPRR